MAQTEKTAALIACTAIGTRRFQITNSYDSTVNLFVFHALPLITLKLQTRSLTSAYTMRLQPAPHP